MKKISVLLCALLIICTFSSLTAFAASTTDAKIVLEANKSSINVGDEVKITIKVYGETQAFADANHNGERYTIRTAKAAVQWSTAVYECIECEIGSSTMEGDPGTTKPVTVGSTQANGYNTFTALTASSQPYDTGFAGTEYILGTITLKAIAVPTGSDTANVTFKNGSQLVANKPATVAFTSAASLANANVGTAANISVTAVAEEDFAIEQSAENTNTVITIWAKNKSGAAIEAGKYGATLGGQTFLGGLGSKITRGTYADETVPVDGKWVIKVVDDLGTVFVKDAAFDWSAFYVDGTGTHTVGSGTYTITE